MSFLHEVQLDDEFGPFVAFQEALGFVPNLLHAQTLLPRVIEAQTKLESAVRLREGSISRIQTEPAVSHQYVRPVYHHVLDRGLQLFQEEIALARAAWTCR